MIYIIIVASQMVKEWMCTCWTLALTTRSDKIIIMKCKMNKIYNNNNNNKQWVNEKDVGQFIHPEGCHPRMLQE